MPAPENLTPHLTPVEREIEAALAGAMPVPATFGPEQLAFALGNASARRRLAAWRTAAGVLAISLVASITVTVQQRSDARQPTRTEALLARDTSTRDASAADPELVLPRSARSYAGLRSVVFSEGIEAIPSPPVGSGESPGVNLSRPEGGGGGAATLPPRQVPQLIRSFLLIGGA